ncbi:nitrogen fixation protein NifR [Staphylococcus aureus]|nr:nitrogen fixation protein NifR [Staphylococcus aureus]
MPNFYRQCKLGCGPQHREFRKEFLQTMQVGGAPTQKLTKSQLTIMCELGWDNDKEILFL